MSRMKKFGTAAVVMSAGFALLSGCGGGDNFDAKDVPGLSIEGWTGNAYQLDIDRASVQNVQQKDSLLILRSSDKAALKITKLEWVARPDRLVVLGSSDKTLDADGNQIPCTAATEAEDCSVFPGSICLAVNNAHCRTTDLPATPIEIPSGLQEQLQFVVKKGSGQLVCPTPGPSVPEDYKEKYCGELLIETNAKNNAGIVKDGNARLYFLVDEKSGEISLTPQFIEFANAKPGVSQSAQFVVSNTASQPLTIQQISIYPTHNMLTISPEAPLGTSTIIAANSSETYTLTFTPPASATDAELKFVSDIQFESSSIGNSSPVIKVNVTPEAGNTPQITVDPLTLSFIDTESQTITIQNSGKTVGQITGVSVSPPAAREQYKVLYEGEDILKSFPTKRPTLAKMTGDEPSKIEFVVEFVPPADPNESTLATLTIRHNDLNAGSKTEVKLLGNSTDLALGQVLPTQYTFEAGKAGQKADFVVYNLGSDPLEITGMDLELPVGAEAGLFTVSNMVGTIPAGGLMKGTATYAGTTVVQRRATLKLTSNTAGEAQDMTLQFVAQPPLEAVKLAPVITPSFMNNAKVGEVTTFTVSDASGTANLQGASWLILERPAGSTAFVSGSGATTSFKADVAGSYKVSVVVPNNNDVINAQAVLEFNAID